MTDLRKGREVALEASVVRQQAVSPLGTGYARDSDSGLESKARGDRRDEDGGSRPPALTHVLLSVPLTLPGDLSSANVAGDQMNTTSRCVARDSTEDAHHTHIPSRPGVTGPNRERDHKPQAPPLRLGVVCFTRG